MGQLDPFTTTFDAAQMRSLVDPAGSIADAVRLLHTSVADVAEFARPDASLEMARLAATIGSSGDMERVAREVRRMTLGSLDDLGL